MLKGIYTKKDHVTYLNQLAGDLTRDDIFSIIGHLFKNEDDFNKKFRSINMGSKLRKDDPIAFNVSYHEESLKYIK